MKLLKRINDMSILELQDLQEGVLTEIQRRKAISSGDLAVKLAEPEAGAEMEMPATLPGPGRGVSRMPRRLRRAA